MYYKQITLFVFKLSIKEDVLQTIISKSKPNAFNSANWGSSMERVWRPSPIDKTISLVALWYMKHLQSVQQPGKPGKPGILREFDLPRGKPGKPGKLREFFCLSMRIF